MIDFEAIKNEFNEKYSKVPGIVSIDLSQNLIRVLLISDNVVEDENLPATFKHDPQDFEIGIEYDTLDRVDTRKKYAEQESNLKQFISDVENSTPTQ